VVYTEYYLGAICIKLVSKASKYQKMNWFGCHNCPVCELPAMKIVRDNTYQILLSIELLC